MLRSFGFAFQGIKLLLKERNFRIHLVAAAMVVVAGLWLNVNSYEWMLLVLFISLVLSLEALNTGIELLCDKLMPETNKYVKSIKDICAGMVLVAAIGSLVCAGLIFYPYLLGLI